MAGISTEIYCIPERENEYINPSLPLLSKLSFLGCFRQVTSAPSSMPTFHPLPV